MKEWLLLVLPVLLVGFFLAGRAGRLDRLHLRLEASREALDAQLVRRAGIVLEIAGSGRLDPATSVVLAEAAQASVAADGADGAARAAVESALTQVLRGVLIEAEGADELRGTPEGRQLLDDLNRACDRVVFARRFHNDAVAAVQRDRRRRLNRWFRLAGHAPWPEPFDIDDVVGPA